MESPRIDVATELYPNRWTHHILVSEIEEIDDELMGWVKEASAFFGQALNYHGIEEISTKTASGTILPPINCDNVWRFVCRLAIYTKTATIHPMNAQAYN